EHGGESAGEQVIDRGRKGQLCVAQAKALFTVGQSSLFLFVVSVQRHTDIGIQFVGGCAARCHDQWEHGKGCKTFKHRYSGDKTAAHATRCRRALLDSKQISVSALLRDYDRGPLPPDPTRRWLKR